MSFTDDLRRFQGRAGSVLDQYTKLVVQGCLASLVERSPVGDPSLWAPSSLPAPKGYEGGHFKANWQIGIDDINYLVTDDIDPTGEISLAEGGKIPDQASGHIYYISNSLPYAQRLENGWSTQAPSGMVALTLLDLSFIKQVAADTLRFL